MIRPALRWTLLGVVSLWAALTAADLPGNGGFAAGLGIGLGAAAGGVSWAIRNLRAEPKGGGDKDDGRWQGRVETLLDAHAEAVKATLEEMRAHTQMMGQMMRDATAYYADGRRAMAAIDRLERK